MRALAGLLVVLVSTAAAAADSATESQKFVDAIQSVDQVKAGVRESLSAIDHDCAVGSCANANATQICRYTAALDVQVGGAITATDPRQRRDARFSISPSDLSLFQRIWAQCKPTSYQFWNYPDVLHVWYAADPAADAQIRQALGMTKATRSEAAPNPGIEAPAIVNSADTICGAPNRRCTDAEFPSVVAALQRQWTLTPEWLRAKCVGFRTFPAVEDCILGETVRWLGQHPGALAPWIAPEALGLGAGKR
jgi:hypothetical protein